jgi:hypothetical protein
MIEIINSLFIISYLLMCIISGILFGKLIIFIIHNTILII